MKTSASVLLTCTTVLFFLSCTKSNVLSGNVLSLHELRSFTTELGSEVIRTYEIEPDPLVNDSDFISYNPEDFSFELRADAADRLAGKAGFQKPMSFALVLGDSVVYTGYFWPSILSKSCNWFTADPYFVKSHRTLKIELGYPESYQHGIKDVRDNPALKQHMKETGRLR